MANRSAPDIAEVLASSERRLFVGRAAEMSLFRTSLTASPATEEYRLIFSVSGPSGAGKTWLLRRLQEEAVAADARTATTDETDTGPIEVMRRLALQLQHKRKFNKFLAADKTYQELRSKVANDPAAPTGLASTLGRAASKGIVTVSKELIPGASTALEFVDSEAIVEQGGEVAQYLASKFKKREERRLLQDPIDTLTPLFVEGLRGLGTRSSRIVLLFDAFEQTSGLLESWLKRTLTQKYGGLPPSIYLVIAGQEQLSRVSWSRFEGVMTRVTLGELAVSERAEYLERVGSPLAQLPQRASELPGLPAALATAAFSDGEGATPAVADSLLANLESEQQALLLRVALPRTLNKDIVALVNDASDDDAWRWLQERPFIEEGKRGWSMHTFVRRALLERFFKESPSKAVALSRELRSHYADQMDTHADDRAASLSRRFRDATAEALYHDLCADYDQALSMGLTVVATGLTEDGAWAYRLAAAVDQAEEDRATPSAGRWGRDLLRAASNDTDPADVIPGLTRLLEASDLTIAPVVRVELLGARAELWRELHHYDRAVSDLEVALEHSPGNPFVLASLARARQLVYQWPDSLREAEAALALVPASKHSLRARVLDIKARAVTELESYAASIPIWTEALQEVDDQGGLWLNRGVAYNRSGQLELAASDFTRFGEVDPDSRAQAALLVARLDYDAEDPGPTAEAFRQVVVRFPDDVGAWYAWVDVLNDMADDPGDVARAILDLRVPATAAVEGCRASALEIVSPQAAISSLLTLLDGKPLTDEDLNRLGLLYSQTGEHDKAISYYNRGLEDEPQDIPLLYNRAVAALHTGSPEAERFVLAANTSLGRMEVDALQATYARAGLAAAAGEVTDALRLLSQATALDEVAIEWAERDIAWDTMRGDERFIVLVDGH